MKSCIRILVRHHWYIMIAFELFWRPVYRYGIFYLITFVVGYIFLWWLPRGRFFDTARQKKYPRLHNLLLTKLDDVFLVIMLWVILWWRLWHIVFYERAYYSQNLLDIFKVNQWGMSFVWGICGVLLGIRYLFRKHKLTRDEIFLFGDMILLIVPLWSFLGRYGNFLNQELIGKEITKVSEWIVTLFQSLNLTTVYDQRDTLERINTNIFQSLAEGWILLLVGRIIFLTLYRKSDVSPWLITGVYFIGYAVARFLAEFLKDLPEYEILGMLSVSQWMTIVLALVGWYILFSRTKK